MKISSIDISFKWNVYSRFRVLTEGPDENLVPYNIAR